MSGEGNFARRWTLDFLFELVNENVLEKELDEEFEEATEEGRKKLVLWLR